MKQITVHNLSDEALECARERARREGKSLNDLYVELIETGLGLSADPQTENPDRLARDSDNEPDWEKFRDEELDRTHERDWT